MTQIIKRLVAFSATLTLSMSSLFVFAPGIVHAAADTCTWTGAGATDDFSDSGNWGDGAGPIVECDGTGIPENGDSLYFPDLGVAQTPDNDIVGLSVAGIDFDAAHATYTGAYTITGNELTLTGDITETGTAGSNNHNQALNLDVTLGAAVAVNADRNSITFGGTTLDVVTFGLTFTTGGSIYATIAGSGNITMTDYVYLGAVDNSAYTGNFLINSGGGLSNGISATVATDDIYGSATSSITVADGGSLYLSFDDQIGTTHTFAHPLTLNGDGANGYGSLAVNDVYSATPALDITISGVTYGSNVEIDTNFDSRDSIVKIVGTTGSFTTTRNAGSNGKLQINGVAQDAAPYQETYVPTGSDWSASPTTVYSMTKYIANGKLGAVTVNADGVLAGNGTTGTVTVNAFGKLAPGASPGCLSTGDVTMNVNSIYDVEIGGATACGQYDRTNVTGTVSIGHAELNIQQLFGYVPGIGVSFVIISNDSNDAVTGTFNNIAQGGTKVVNGITYTVSYTGGDGNDVTLTVTGLSAEAAASAQGGSTPGTPNTGVGSLVTNPLAVLTSTTLLAGAILAISRKYKLLKG